MSSQRRSTANKRWRAQFHTAWRKLCLAHGNVELTPALAQLARAQRADGHGPEPTAAGIYWGTKHAELDKLRGGQN